MEASLRTRLTGLVLAALSLPLPALATCVCRCVDGEMVPICTSSLDLPPICPPTICPIVAPSIQPVEPPVVPPIGTTRCEQKQVWSDVQQRYVWREICE
jgi:hypothetical protein